MMMPLFSKLYLTLSLLLFVSPLNITNNSISLLKVPVNVTVDNCQSWGWINNITVTMSREHNYTRGVYVCKDFANSLLVRLNEYGCSAKLVTGWFGEKGTQRGWHRWVQTPYFNIEATPDDAGIIMNNSKYDASYYSPMNFSYEQG